MIYWVRSGDIGPTKVGYAASNVQARVKSLQTGSPHPLVVLRVEAGGRNMETALHRHYRAKHVRAEWFLLTDADVSVDLACVAPWPPPEMARERTEVYEMLQSLGGQREVAARLSAGRTAVANWARDGVPAKYWPDLVALARELNVPGITFRHLAATSSSKRNRAVLSDRAPAAA